MSDEELDKVAGGTPTEIAEDSLFLNSLNGSCNRYDPMTILAGGKDEEIKKAWAAVGVEAKLGNFIGRGSANEYYVKETGEWLTHQEAREYAMNVVGKQMKKSDWYW